MYRQIIKELPGWTINDIEETDYETLIEILCSKPKQKKIDPIDYMKGARGLTVG